MNGILKRVDTATGVCEKDKVTQSHVSVIILNHNGERFIEDCIKSVLTVDYPDKEIIVVDDHSNDGSLRIIERYHGVKLIHNKGKRGFGASANTGIRYSRGEIVVLLNMDTLVDKEWLSTLVNAIISDERIGIAGSKIVFPDRKTIQYAGAYLQKSGISYHIGRGEIDAGQYDIPKEVEYVCGVSMGIRRSVIEEIGYFDESFSPLYYEDVDFAWRARKKEYKVMYIPGSIVSHYENCSVGKSSPEFYYLYHKNRVRFVIKNYSMKEFLINFIPEEKRWFKRATRADEELFFTRRNWGEEERRWFKRTARTERYAALKAYLVGIGYFPWLLIRRCLWRLSLI